MGAGQARDGNNRVVPGPSGPSLVRVTVVYCPPETLWMREVDLAAGATLRGAIEASGVLTAFPELERGGLAAGVFSRRRELDEPLHEGDRVEIYRPLLVEPKDARRLRAGSRRRKAADAADE